MTMDEIYQKYPDSVKEVDKFFYQLREILPAKISLTMEQGMEIHSVIEEAILYGHKVTK